MSLSRLIYGGKKFASCSLLGDWAWAKHLNVSKKSGKVGDIVLYDFNGNGTSDHVGLIVEVVSGGYYAIEGNTSSSNSGSQDNGGGVYKRFRTYNNINYCIRVPYENEEQRKLILDKAKSQLGITESPKNSNNVKYNTWYYGKAVSGSSYPWCAVFICWLFAFGDVVEKVPDYPTVTLKKGMVGVQVKSLQKCLNKILGTNLDVDGEFGARTLNAVKVFQSKYNLKTDGVSGAKTNAKIKELMTNSEKLGEKPSVEKKIYGGTFPILQVRLGHAMHDEKGNTTRGKSGDQNGKEVAITNWSYSSKNVWNHWTHLFRNPAKAEDICKNMIWACENSNIGYDAGSNRYTFTDLAKKVKYDARKVKTKCETTCGQLVGVCLEYAGVKMPRYVSNLVVIKQLEGKFTLIQSRLSSQFKLVKGDILVAKGHHTCVVVQGYCISKGDVGSEIKKLQAFLNWYGEYKLAEDGIFFDKTLEAVKDFQTKEGLAVDGQFGTASVAKAKTVER